MLYYHSATNNLNTAKGRLQNFNSIQYNTITLFKDSESAENFKIKAFVLAFSCFSEKDFTSALENFTNLSLAIFHWLFAQATMQRREMTSSIFPLLRIWKMRHSSTGCSFVWMLWVVYFPVKHSCLYNNHDFATRLSGWRKKLFKVFFKILAQFICYVRMLSKERESS